MLQHLGFLLKYSKSESRFLGEFYFSSILVWFVHEFLTSLQIMNTFNTCDVNSRENWNKFNRKQKGGSTILITALGYSPCFLLSANYSISGSQVHPRAPPRRQQSEFFGQPMWLSQVLTAVWSLSYFWGPSGSGPRRDDGGFVRTVSFCWKKHLILGLL